MFYLVYYCHKVIVKPFAGFFSNLHVTYNKKGQRETEYSFLPPGRVKNAFRNISYQNVDNSNFIRNIVYYYQDTKMLGHLNCINLSSQIYWCRFSNNCFMLEHFFMILIFIFFELSILLRTSKFIQNGQLKHLRYI